MNFPRRIVCLTEESVETLYLLGCENLIVGASAFVKRPPATKDLKKVSAFTSANIPKILELEPDLVLGFSDIQKDIARELIGEGVNVFIANHRSLDEILDYIRLLGRLVNRSEKADELVLGFQQKIQQTRHWSESLNKHPKVYLEEWDEPMITGIQWFSELAELCGAKNVFREKSLSSKAKGRIVAPDEVTLADPDIILACWCGKTVDILSIKGREGFEEVAAVKQNQVFELEPEIFLQPGPAPFVDGLEILQNIIGNWAGEES